MEDVKLLKEYGRICSLSKGNCNKCTLSALNNVHGISCRRLIIEEPVCFIKIVEQWSKEHPVKTRQDLFLERFPNTELGESCNVIVICPCYIDNTLRKPTEEPNIESYSISKCKRNVEFGDCFRCGKAYWGEEVE